MRALEGLTAHLVHADCPLVTASGKIIPGACDLFIYMHFLLQEVNF